MFHANVLHTGRHALVRRVASRDDMPLLRADMVQLGSWPNSIFVMCELAVMKACFTQVFIQRGMCPKLTQQELTPHIATGSDRETFVRTLDRVAPCGIRFNPAYVHVHGNSLQWQFVLDGRRYHYTLVYCTCLPSMTSDDIQQCISHAVHLYRTRNV